MMKYTRVLNRKIKGKIKFYAQARFKEPIVILESDDWGMERGHENVAAIRQFGKIKDWAYDRPASPSQLRALYDLLGQYRDQLGRPWRIVANFIVQNPDFEKTIQDDFRQLHVRSIDEDTGLVAIWREGVARGVFYPQYHGRLHYNLQVLEEDLQSDESGARDFFRHRFHGSFDNIAGIEIHNHSEYFNCRLGQDYSLTYLKEWIGTGLRIFQRVFGFFSESTIAPHYIFTPLTAAAMKACGIKYIQAADRQNYFDRHRREIVLNLPFGSSHYPGLTALNRNITFEPFRMDFRKEKDRILSSIKWLFKNNVPVVINTHRINYTGKFFGEGLAQLEQLLEELKVFNPLVMTSDELGEAICNDGSYHSRTNGERIRLTPADCAFFRPLRDRLVIREYKE